VVLGGGYGGVYAALRLQGAARRGRIQLDLVSRENFFLFQPMLAEVVSGSIEPPHIVNPLRRLCRYTNVVQAEIEGVDVEGRSVIVGQAGKGDYRYMPYDHLVIAVGTSTDLSGLPGVAEHAFPFKTLGDALYLRNHLIGVLERAEVEEDPRQKAEMLTFVIVGGGYTGVEVAAEIHDFVREAARSYRHVDPREIRVLLLQGRGRILPELDPGLAAFSHRLLERRGIEVRLETRIAGATADTVLLNNGEGVPTRTLVAAVGAAPNRLLDSLPCPRDSRGRLVVDPTLAVPGYPGLWAVGDCAAVPDLKKGGTCPPTAQFALRQAKHTARNILAAIDGRGSRPFLHRNLGVFVPLGRYSAAAEVVGAKLSGLPAWWLYRTYYLYQLPRLERKVKVLIDWNLALLFRRDIVHQDIARSERTSRAHYEAGQMIIRQGELARSFYIILTGKVQVLVEQDGKEREVAVLGPGEFFGEIALLQGARRNAAVRALTPMDLLAMNGADFTALATSSTDFAQLLSGVMERRLADNALRPRPGPAAAGGGTGTPA
jgi:NADH dehydrogenase